MAGYAPVRQGIFIDSLKLESLKHRSTSDGGIRSLDNSASHNQLSRQLIPTENTTHCSPPFDLKTWDIKDTEAKTSWSVSFDTISINMQYRKKDSSTWITVLSNQKAKEFLLSGLESGTTYQWRIQTVCPLTLSDWFTISFTTTGLIKCPPPFNLGSGGITDSSAFVNWSAWVFEGSGPYYVEYKESSSSTWIPVLKPYLPTHELELLRDLKPSTNYDWRVLIACTPDSSDWAYGSFKTLAEAPPLPPPPSVVKVTVDFSFSTPACEPALYNFSNNSTATGTTIKSVTWDFGDGSTSTVSDPLHQYKNPGSYTVILNAKDDSGRSYSKQKIITINSLSLRFANAGKDFTVCTETPVQLKATGGVSYTWQPCIGLDNCNIENPYVSPGLNNTYIVTVTSVSGCIDKDTITVSLNNTNANFYIPNAFTPNNDGINDQFKPLVSMQGQAEAEWKLFNRFGNMIYSSNSSTAGWDGRYKGEAQPTGIYTYFISMKASGACPPKNIKGTVQLIR